MPKMKEVKSKQKAVPTPRKLETYTDPDGVVITVCPTRPEPKPLSARCPG